MEHYYFNIYNDTITPDEEGAPFPDLEAARAFAIRGARSLAAQTVLEGHLTLGHRIEIADAEQIVLAVVRFGDAVKVTG